ncbi:SGNH/GDSL hydrolase family protein [Actinacidiphila sp. ITFR-21]|uniref:SGNH/GDSL hydrolase family protein n=1 Tax=Actinacidiphila sp. ITFR-21 TaxID=3075199 RepID=UPI00288B7416|nr:SGNH/GDSL hydrolase family protein [Streptomyces sp. ITFR-21]WNI14502.1 SGNH/GDSL hydrolase family protein [Streptomyces sp. ITFR-21]
MTHGRLVRGAGVPAALLTVAAAITLALLTTSGSAVESRPRPPFPVRVMPLGDSITWGQGSTGDAGYRKPLWRLVAGQSRYAVRFVGSERNGDLPEPANEGHRGWTIGQVRGRVDGWLAVSRPDVVLLHLGINDLRHNVDVARAPDRLAELVDRIYADRPGVSVVYMGLLPVASHQRTPLTTRLRAEVAAFDRRAAALQAAERRRGRAFWYVTPPDLTVAEMSDGVHPDDAGYRRMAEAFFPVLGKAVAERMSRPAPSPSPPAASAPGPPAAPSAGAKAARAKAVGAGAG